MLNLTNEELLTELMTRARTAGNTDAMAALVLVEESFPSQPPAATPVVSPTAQPAPHAPSAQNPPSASAAPVAGAAPTPEPAPMLRVEMPKGSPHRVQEVGLLVQTLVSRFLRADLPPLSMRLMQLAADVATLEQAGEQR